MVMQKIQNLMKILRKKRFLIPIILIVVIIVISKINSANGVSNMVKAENSVFEKTVSVSGKVVPIEKVDLSFETNGTVQNIYKDVGQRVNKGEVIASLNYRDSQAERDAYVAELDIAINDLNNLKNNTNNSDTETKKSALINKIIEAYNVSDDSVRNKVDQFFKDGRSPSPKILYSFRDSSDIKYKLNDDRAYVETLLTDWQKNTTGLSITNFSDNVADLSLDNIYKVNVFLRDVSMAVNSFEVSNEINQTTIDKYKSDISKARADLSAVISGLVSAKDALRSSISSASVQEAKVRSAEANINKIDAKIAKAIIKAPFSGVISEKEIELGQSVPQNQKAFTLIGSSLEIEAFIPEINLPGITVGNKVTIKLDAYSDEEFFGTISRIDPAETEKDGVSNYKVKISFDNTDERIKSGMTSDVWIVTAKRENVLLIPLRAVTKENGKAFVFVPNNKESIKTEVVLGENDGKGSVEILSGITDGQELILNQE